MASGTLRWLKIELSGARGAFSPAARVPMVRGSRMVNQRKPATIRPGMATIMKT